MRRILDYINEGLFNVDDEDDLLNEYIGNSLGGDNTPKLTRVVNHDIYLKKPNTNSWTDEPCPINDSCKKFLKMATVCNTANIFYDSNYPLYIDVDEFDYRKMNFYARAGVVLDPYWGATKGIREYKNITIKNDTVSLGIDLQPLEEGEREKYFANITNAKLIGSKIECEDLVIDMKNHNWEFQGCKIKTKNLYLSIFVNKTDSSMARNTKQRIGNELNIYFNKMHNSSHSMYKPDFFKNFPNDIIDLSNIQFDNIKLLSNQTNYVVGKDVKGSPMQNGYGIDIISKKAYWKKID